MKKWTQRFQREKIYIIPTFYGLMYGAGIIVCLMSGVVYGNNLAYLLCFFLVALFIIGMHQSHTNMKNLKFEKMELELTSENSVGRGKIWLKSENLDGHSSLFIQANNKQDKLESIVDHLQKKAFSVHRFQWQAGPRGARSFDKVKISSRFPFGLFYVWRNYKTPAKLFVYPRPEGDLPIPKDLNDGDSTIHTQQKKGEDFSGHEKFQPGESQKRIDWKAFARGRPMLVKRFEDGTTKKVAIYLPSGLKDPEMQLRQMSQWVDLCEKKQWNYSWSLGTKTLSFGNGPSHRSLCLQQLAEYNP